MLLGHLVLLSLGLLAGADETVYAPGSGALASGWENWSWSSTIDFASTSGPGGVQAISVTAGSYAALSLFDETAFANNFAGLRFDISGAQPDVSLSFSSSTDSDSSASIPLAAMSSLVNASAWTTVTIDFGNLPANGGVLPADSCEDYTLPHVASNSMLTIWHKGIESTSRQAVMVLPSLSPTLYSCRVCNLLLRACHSADNGLASRNHRHPRVSLCGTSRRECHRRHLPGRRRFFPSLSHAE